MNEVNNNYIEQGWQCPICKTIMSPKERTCVNCTKQLTTTTTIPNDFNTHLADFDQEFEKLFKTNKRN